MVDSIEVDQGWVPYYPPLYVSICNFPLPESYSGSYIDELWGIIHGGGICHTIFINNNDGSVDLPLLRRGIWRSLIGRSDRTG